MKDIDNPQDRIELRKWVWVMTDMCSLTRTMAIAEFIPSRQLQMLFLFLNTQNYQGDPD